MPTSIYLKKTSIDLCKPNRMTKVRVFRAERLTPLIAVLLVFVFNAPLPLAKSSTDRALVPITFV